MTAPLIDIAAIRARVEAATPPSWGWEIDSKWHRYIRLWSDRHADDVLTVDRDEYLEITEADADFIRFAREDVPALLAECDRLRDIENTLKDDLSVMLVEQERLRADNAALQRMCDNLAAESGRQLQELARLRGEVKRMERYQAGIREMATREGPYLD
jgi:hypothetical protein